MKRLFDLIMAFILLLVVLFPMLIISLAIKITSPGKVLHWSERVGRDNKIFMMPKFRSMKEETPNVASHLLSDPQLFFTPIGAFLRRSSLDELPQLYSILVGDMSFVGPRPALSTQEDLINLRLKNGVSCLMPGITGMAQINGRDSLSIFDKAQYDKQYLEKKSFFLDLKILWLTVIRVILGVDISH